MNIRTTLITTGLIAANLMNMKKVKFLVAFPVAILTASVSYASTISGTNGFGIPVVPNATATIDFDGQPDASFSSLSLGGVTFTGIDGYLRTDNTYPNQYNGRGSRYLDNNGSNVGYSGSTSTIRFDFAAPVSAFAFNLGASNYLWVLTAFDAANNVIESFNLPITASSNGGEYVGLANAGMAYATLVASPGDWIFIDNFTVAAQVPEPETYAMLLAGLGLVGIAARRRKLAEA